MDEPLASIEAYCQAIGIARPKYSSVDVRRFEDNMASVRARVAPFTHQFFSVALKLEGGGSVRAGLDEFALGDSSYVFFNSPHQLQGWEIVPDWSGYYVIFTREFAGVHLRIQDMTAEFPFLRLDRALPLRVAGEHLEPIHVLFQKLHAEYHGDAEDKFGFIAAYTHLLLRYVKRFFNAAPIEGGDLGEANATAEYRLVSRFQVLLEASSYPDSGRERPLTVAEIAEQLYVHPNYLNSIVKGVTGHPAKELVAQQTLAVAQRLLAQPGQSVKQVAWTLGFAEPTHFSRFFKRLTGVTPSQWRDQQLVL